MFRFIHTVLFSFLLKGMIILPSDAAISPSFSPYFDVNLGVPNLVEYMRITGQKDFTLAFALGGSQGCHPTWGGQADINDPSILNPIKEVIAAGGRMTVATGGAVGPYLEHLCRSSEDLLNAYKIVLDTVGTNHLDIDIESPIDIEQMNRALAALQSERPEVSVSFTLMIQGEDYGMVPSLGTIILESAKANGVRVDLVNLMTMEFPGMSPDWGDSVINAAIASLSQMRIIWPEKSEEELKKMLGVTPMIGRNFNGKVFEPQHGRKLVDWANANNIGHLSFWSIGRDNGGCPDGSVSPYCSGTIQDPQEFTSIFQGFEPTDPVPPVPTTPTTIDPSATTAPTTSTTLPSVECVEEGILGVKCYPVFWQCVIENGTFTKYEIPCWYGLVFDPALPGCNWPQAAGC